MANTKEIFDLVSVCYPDIIYSPNQLKQLIACPENRLFESRQDGKLIGVLLLRGNTVLIFCVLPVKRCQGVGSSLLSQAEACLLSQGIREIKLCQGGEYFTPGAPMYSYTRAFFDKRGYVHEGDENRSVDMLADLNSFTYSEHRLGDTIDGVTYRWATLQDRESTVNCAGAALQEFAEFYWDEKLYHPENPERVLIATIPSTEGEIVCGALLVDFSGIQPGIGTVGCTSVAPQYSGRGIATNMVRLATGQIKEAGLKKAFLSYTYSEIVHMYGRSGYEICMRYYMGKKQLTSKKTLPPVKKEIVIQYRELEGNMDGVEERIYRHLEQKGISREDVRSLTIYLKPQDFTAYYVANDSEYGKVGIF